MATGQVCGRCGCELAVSTASGYCPSCMLREALREVQSPKSKVQSPNGMEGGGSSAESEVQSPASKAQDSSETIPNPSPLIPGPSPLTRFGNYELLQKIGQGGMGIVYKARQVNLDRIVALKLLPFGQFSREDIVQRFHTEATAAAALQHPNIVAIHDVGEQDGQHYFSMDFVTGQTLAEVVREKPLPAKRAAGYLKAIAEAVHYAHQHGILHRDLKPSNILIDESDQPRITDFGLAKRLTVDSDMTLTGQVLGSPNFMAPEQAEGRLQAIGPATEVYSLGALLYHLLTRQPPFQADTLTMLLKQVVETDPVAPRLLNPSIPRDLETICLKCLEKDPPRRYQTAQALAEELGRFLDDKPIQARPVNTAGQIWKWCRRRPALAGMSAALALSVLLGMAGVVWQWRRAGDNELLTRQSAYAADMKLAQHALDDGDIGLATGLLDKHRPGGKAESRKQKTESDLRGWEWRYLWRLCQGDETLRLHRYPDPIGALAVSRDARLLAVRAGGDKVGVWDLMAKHPIAELAGSGLKALAFSPTDTLLAFASRNARGEPTVELWDTEKRKLGKPLNPGSPVRSLAFSPDGKLLATFDDKGTAAVIEWRLNRILKNLTARPPRRGEAGVVAFSPDGHRLAVGGDYGQIRVVDWRSGNVLPIQTQTSDGVTALAFSPDSKLLAAGFAYTTGTIRLWDSDSGAHRGQLTNHTQFIYALAFSPDGQRLASASADQTIRIWNLATCAEVRRLQGHRDQVWALAFAPDGRTLISGSKDGWVYFWDASTGSQASAHTTLRISSGFDSMAKAESGGFTPGMLDPKVVYRVGLAFMHDSRSFITTDPNGSLAVWSTQPLQQTEPLPMLRTNNWGVALSRDGRWLAAGDASGEIHVWDWEVRRHVKSLKVPFEWFGYLRFSRGGNFLFAKLVFNDETDRVRIWRTRDWEPVRLAAAQESGINSAGLSPDERHLAAGYIDGWVRLWSFPGGQLEDSWRPHTEGVVGVLFSEDGRVLVSTSTDHTVRLRDVIARRELVALRGHISGAWGAAFSPDSRRLATGGGAARGGRARDAVKLWDMATHRELLTLPADGQFFLDVRFSPNGNILTATSLDGIAHLWRAPSWGEIQVAEKAHQAE